MFEVPTATPLLSALPGRLRSGRCLRNASTPPLQRESCRRRRPKSERRAEAYRLAEYMGGRPLGSGDVGDASKMPNRCAAAAMPDPSKSPSWNGWERGTSQHTVQGCERLRAHGGADSESQVEMGIRFPAGVCRPSGSPPVAAGRIFVGSDIGYVYSLDMHTGCVLTGRIQTKSSRA